MVFESQIDTLRAAQPIGIFDSGIGGLTVAHAVAELLPQEDIIYIGDTAHLPYGDKSADTICHYVRDIAEQLLAKQCKLLLIACNSATAAAYQDLCHYLAGRAELMGVIEPVIDHIVCHHAQQRIGLIGTRQTINSNVFAQKLAAKIDDLQFSAVATPLLVPVIEEGFHDQCDLVDAVLKVYLTDPALKDVEALILGCTHYPVIKPRLHAYYGPKVVLIDAAEITAKALQQRLSQLNLLNPQSKSGSREFYVSDLTPAFARQARGFFGEAICLQALTP